MPSLRSRVIRLILDFRRSRFDWNAPPQRFRALMKRQERFFKPPRDVDIQPVVRLVAHAANRLSPPGASRHSVLLYLHGAHGSWDGAIFIAGWSPASPGLPAAAPWASIIVLRRSTRIPQSG